MSKVLIKDNFFVDEDNRVLFLRGVNLGAGCKIRASPTLVPSIIPCEPGSFINQPFPVTDAEKHFKLLASAGMNLIRFSVPWESIEPSPGKYDTEFIDSLLEIIEIGSKFKFHFFIDPHQDTVKLNTNSSGVDSVVVLVLPSGH